MLEFETTALAILGKNAISCLFAYIYFPIVFYIYNLCDSKDVLDSDGNNMN